MAKQFITSVSLIFIWCTGLAQSGYWQQRVEYTMDVKMNTNTHRFEGTQHLVYYNNSPDTLKKVYFHLYFNAFQPGSMMDVRSRNISDPDRRVGDRISKLKDNEIGYQHISFIKQDNTPAAFKIEGTVMEVKLNKPLLPKSKTIFDLQFNAQVPLQIRRSGRDNSEGIAYSMTQWYPKMAEYDFQGWHNYQYVAREFHGVWGDFNVSITMDPSFTIAATGILQNPDKIGHGYESGKATPPVGKADLTWNFIAKDVIDFAWAADPDYTHTKAQVPNGPVIHLFYQKNEKNAETWKKMEDVSVKVFQFLNEHFGQYPFSSYSIIQGGDGGMEYPMCTLILGEGRTESVLGTMAHEVAHSWYQMALASNESLNPWMDEGYTSFASAEAMAAINNTPHPHDNAYQGYFAFIKGSWQEPPNQHSDHFSTNRAYSTVAYSMGEVFLEQMKYLIGDDHFYRGMKLYYNTWKMKHPSPNDFIRMMEKTSDLQLGWYLRYWINTNKKIDYGFGVITDQEGATNVEIKRLGEFPMPIDLQVIFKDGTHQIYYIPMNELMGIKPSREANRIVRETWPWVNPSYVIKIDRKLSEIESLEIDPSQRMADSNRTNNKVVLSEIIPYRSPLK